MTQKNVYSSDCCSDSLLHTFMDEENFKEYDVPPLERLKIKIDVMWNESLKSLAEKKNNEIDKIYTIYSNTVESVLSHTPFSILYVEWCGLLCYKSTNWLDFTKLKGATNLISAKNGGGKSSILEIICVSIYGKPIPSRNVKGNALALICKNKHKNLISETAIHIRLGQTTYRICRAFDKDGKLKQRTGGVYRLCENNTWNVVVMDPPKTNEWVQSKIGNIHGFLMTTMVSQSNDDDFLSLKPQEQRIHLEDLLGMKIATAKAVLFKQVCSHIKSFKGSLQLACTYHNIHKDGTKDALDTLETIYTIKSTHVEHLKNQLYQSWSQYKESDLKLHTSMIQSNVTQAQKQLESLQKIVHDIDDKLETLENMKKNCILHVKNQYLILIL